MNRFFFILLFLIPISVGVSAQTKLEIDNLFTEHYASDPQVTETILSGNNKFLKRHNLTVFSTFKGPASKYQQTVERMVLSDARSATGKSVRYKDGKLYFALFILRPVTINGTRLNRYIYYLNNSAAKGHNVLVVYLEGTLSEHDVAKLIQNATKK